jgi:hypothetical protein
MIRTALLNQGKRHVRWAFIILRSIRVVQNTLNLNLFCSHSSRDGHAALSILAGRSSLHYPTWSGFRDDKEGRLG